MEKQPWPYTMLDLRLGLVQLTPEQKAQIHRVIPIFARAGLRTLREMAAREKADVVE